MNGGLSLAGKAGGNRDAEASRNTFVQLLFLSSSGLIGDRKQWEQTRFQRGEQNDN
jgi:hypothetical protein